MAYSEVLLLKPVEGLGGEGEQVRVRAGFARNYLWPRKIAVPVSHANRKQVEALQAARARREAQELDNAKALEEKLSKVSVAIAVKTGEGGKMFGSVTAQDVIKRLADEGIEIEKKRLSLQSPIKALGKHKTLIKIHPEVSFELELEVVSENPIDEVEAGE